MFGSISRLVSTARHTRLSCFRVGTSALSLRSLSSERVSPNLDEVGDVEGKIGGPSVADLAGTCFGHTPHEPDQSRPDLLDSRSMATPVTPGGPKVGQLLEPDSQSISDVSIEVRETESDSTSSREHGRGKSRRRLVGALAPLFESDTSTSADFVKQVEALGRAGQWSKVMHIYKESSENPDVEFEPLMYQATIAALSARSRWREAQLILDDMRSAGHVPSLQSYNEVIRSCVRRSQSGRAFSLFDEMRAAGIAPDAGTYNSLVAGCRDRKWEQALQLLSDMEVAGLKAWAKTFNSAIVACGSAGEIERAFDLLEQMRSRDIAPTQGTFRAVISACGKKGQWERALSLLDEMGHDNLEPNDYCYNAAIHGGSVAGVHEASRARKRSSRRFDSTGHDPGSLPGLFPSVGQRAAARRATPALFGATPIHARPCPERTSFAGRFWREFESLAVVLALRAALPRGQGFEGTARRVSSQSTSRARVTPQRAWPRAGGEKPCRSSVGRCPTTRTRTRPTTRRSRWPARRPATSTRLGSS